MIKVASFLTQTEVNRVRQGLDSLRIEYFVGNKGDAVADFKDDYYEVSVNRVDFDRAKDIVDRVLAKSKRDKKKCPKCKSQNYRVIEKKNLFGLLDIFGSIASRQLDFNYSNLSFVSFLIYGTTCFLVTKTTDLKTGVIYGMILGFFDSTIGLKISILLDANTGDYNYELTAGFWIIIVVFMIGFGALAGLIGGGLARIVKKRDMNAQQ